MTVEQVRDMMPPRFYRAQLTDKVLLAYNPYKYFRPYNSLLDEDALIVLQENLRRNGVVVEVKIGSKVTLNIEMEVIDAWRE
jgi:NADH dehydrogenase/NADH:ubiquinone oxidoreductase subunit G